VPDVSAANVALARKNNGSALRCEHNRKNGTSDWILLNAQRVLVAPE